MRRAHVADPSITAATKNGYGSQQQMLEEENESMADQLRDKVKALKSLSIDIGTEVREQNKFLNEMDSDFDKGGGFLKATMGRVQAMARAGHNRYIFYLILFALFVFFIIWIIIKTR